MIHKNVLWRDGLWREENFPKTMIMKVSGVYSDPIQTSKMEPFEKLVNGSKPIIIFAISNVLDIQLGSEYASDPFSFNTLKLNS